MVLCGSVTYNLWKSMRVMVLNPFAIAHYCVMVNLIFRTSIPSTALVLDVKQCFLSKCWCSSSVNIPVKSFHSNSRHFIGLKLDNILFLSFLQPQRCLPRYHPPWYIILQVNSHFWSVFLFWIFVSCLIESHKTSSDFGLFHFDTLMMCFRTLSESAILHSRYSCLVYHSMPFFLLLWVQSFLFSPIHFSDNLL